MHGIQIFILILAFVALIIAGVLFVMREDAGTQLRPWAAGLAVLSVVLWFFSVMSLYSVPPDKVGLHYTGGPFQGVHYKEVLTPGTSTKFLGLMENLYLYPATTRNYIVDSTLGQGDRKVSGDFIQTTSSDQIEADWNIIASFRLNTTPATLRRFHESLGLKFSAWTDDGWDTMLNQTLRQVIENKMNAEASKYPLDKLYSDPGVRKQIQDAVGRDLTSGVNNLLNGDFFCGPNFVEAAHSCPPIKFLIKGRPAIPRALKTQFEANRAAQLKVIQRQSEVEQAKKQAEAAEALKAAISDNPSYVLLKAIESGSIKFWVLPSDGSVNLTVPAP